jgi:predicted neutral ceramidase superfamily lipid hydrolase
MDNLFLILAEGISAAMTLVLVRFMIKPYRMTGESRFLGLPMGFTFLGVSNIFMAVSLLPGESSLFGEFKWLQLYTGAYTFIFLAMTYRLSPKTRERRARLLMQGLTSLLFLVLILSIVVVFLPPALAFPSYKTADEYFRFFNMTLALYAAFRTFRSHVKKPKSETVLAPLGYALLALSQYFLLIWSLDSSFSALLGAYVIRIAGLLAFFIVSYEPLWRALYEAIIASPNSGLK